MFKAGDRVECVEGDPGNLEAGRVYTVREAFSDMNLRFLNLDGVQRAGWSASRFKLAEPARPTHIRITKAVSPRVTAGCVYVVTGWSGPCPRVTTDDGRYGFTLSVSTWEPFNLNHDRSVSNSDTPGSGSIAHSVLTEAAGIVQGARNTTHGDKERSFVAIASNWNAYLDARKAGGPITARDVAAMMTVLKLVRSVQGTAARDHFVDAAGYAAIAGELADAETTTESRA